ncbi:MAG: hypothetical protein BWY87_00754 [Deltaproteobacteria bacterium ADurb.Bin510]|jgi:hypothetical protein|nr:MAG: hypothetical protein BWY87_00754 [Deltaproteobacteria bacterium ADurb.Bin510]
MEIKNLNVDLLTMNLPQADKKSSAAKNTAAYTDSLEYSKESLKLDFSFADGTQVSMDWVYEAISRKTTGELTGFSNMTYDTSSLGTDYFTPENTAGRILDFARSLWDGSSEKLDLLASAIDEGVNQAKQILGDMPDWLGATIGKTVDLLHEGIKKMREEIGQTAEA